MADRDGHAALPHARASGGGLLVGVAVVGGLVLMAAGAGLLWASEGASVFLENAFAAVIACF